MSLWDKLQAELDKAGTAAKGALDEGKLRIELFRVRQQTDKAAQALGYALHRAKRDNTELAAETLEHLHGQLAKHEAEAKQLEEELAKALRKDPPPTGSAG
jgi:seryl-tRNA synthetase